MTSAAQSQISVAGKGHRKGGKSRERGNPRFKSSIFEANRHIGRDMNLLKSILGWNENATPKLQAEGTFYIEKADAWTCLYVFLFRRPAGNDAKISPDTTSRGQTWRMVANPLLPSSRSLARMREMRTTIVPASSFGVPPLAHCNPNHDSAVPPEMTFPLHQGMDLAKEVGPLERAAFSWTYTSDEFGVATRYLFEFDREDDFVRLFEAQLCHSMYEAIYQRPAVDASPEDLAAILLPRCAFIQDLLNLLVLSQPPTSVVCSTESLQ